MKNRRRLVGVFILALAVSLLYASVGLAQCWGNGPCWGNQVSQTGWQGRAGWQGRGPGGPGYANCANYGAYGYCAQGQGYYTQGQRGPRGGTLNYSPNSPTPNSQKTQ